MDDTSPDNAYGRESQPGLPATAGVRYTAYAQVWTESGAADLYLRFRDAAGQLLGSVTGGSVSGRKWNTATASGVAPAGTATVSALVYSGVGNVGTAYWDEVVIGKDTTDLGVQLESSVPNATTFAGGKAYAVYTGTADSNPQLAVIDVATGKVTSKLTFPDTADTPTVGGWAATTATDGSVYLGTYPNSKLYRHVPGTSTLTDLGTGTNASLARYDNVTGRTDSLLPAEYAHNSMVGGLTWTGGRLFAWFDRTLLVLQVVKNADGSYRSVVDAAITDTDLHHSPAADGKVWFTKDGLLHSYDIATKAVQPTAVRPDLDVTGYSWENGTLVGLGAAPDGTRIFKYTPATGASSTRLVPGTPVLPAAINALGTGPDGKIYTGGYLTARLYS
ncbi:hypothetical protein ILP97_22980 [Amycolatopsis sp. H6(2020)]|nr:hypothetical protein [Amycolatopsis sp. H6(2020)]